MNKHLPEDPSRFMEEMPSSDPVSRIESGTPPADLPDIVSEALPPAPTPSTVPTGPDEPLSPQNPFVDLDDDENNDFHEDDVLGMKRITPET